jgi:uncharacterized membrane protein (UPF0127 family)
VARRLLVARNVTRGTLIADRLEAGDSFWAKFMGLMGRPSLAPGEGLWLPDGNGIHMMFMRFPIDCVFVGRPSADGTRPVVAIRERLAAWTGLVPLVREAHGVIELPIGAIAASETSIADRIGLEPRHEAAAGNAT